MAPRQIFLIRHAQAEHNVEEDYSIPDAPLTLLGRYQSSLFPHRLPAVVSAADLIVASPLRRTIQTALGAFAPVLGEDVREKHRAAVKKQWEAGPGKWDQAASEGSELKKALDVPEVKGTEGKRTKFVLLPRLQECSDLPCDTGIGLPDLPKSNYGEFSLLDMSPLEQEPEWTSKKGDYGSSQEEITARAVWVRKWLRDRPEEKIAVISHGDFLRNLAEYGVDKRWDNAECRTFEFLDQEGKDDKAKIVRLSNEDEAKVIKPDGEVKTKDV